jgi:mono/diheme cytochrome c family protein
MFPRRFLITVFFAPGTLALVLTVGYPSTPIARADRGGTEKSHSHPKALASGAATSSQVKDLYTKYCLACHAADGKGTEMRKAMATIPDFTSRKWQDSLSNVQIKVSILEGKGTLMPPFRDKISDGENEELSAYLREFAPE